MMEGGGERTGDRGEVARKGSKQVCSRKARGE